MRNYNSIINHNMTKSEKAEYNKLYYQKNKAKLNAQHKAWKAENLESRQKYMREYNANRYASDELFKLSRNLRARLRNAFHYTRNQTYKTKKKSTEEILGCSFEEFKDWIESQFTEGMTFYNIHIDHIIPLSSAKDVDELYKLGHFTNCRPMWPADNISKGCKV